METGCGRVIDKQQLREIERVRQEANGKALVLWTKMKRAIDSIIKNCIGFRNGSQWEDYENEAYLAVYDAVIRYFVGHKRRENVEYDLPECLDITPAELVRMSTMTEQVYAHWYVSKRLYKVAGEAEIEWNVSKDDIYVETVNNAEYRKKKKFYEQNGYKALSSRKTYSFSELATDRNGRVVEFDPAENIEEAVWL